MPHKQDITAQPEPEAVERTESPGVPGWVVGGADPDGGYDGPHAYVTHGLGVLSEWHPATGTQIWLDADDRMMTPDQARAFGLHLVRIADLAGS